MSPRLLTEAEVSEWLKISVPTLRTMRARPGRDPIPFVKVGGRVRYREDSLNKWLQRNTFHDTHEAQEHRKTGT